MTSSYRSYHSGLKLQYASGNLQSDVTNSIQQRWKGKNIQSFWTPYPLKESRSVDGQLFHLERENAKLKVQVKSLF